MTGLRGVLAVALVAVATGCAQLPPRPSVQEQFAQLLKDSDEDSLRRDPLQAIYRGDLRYATQFGDYLSDAALAADRAAVSEDLKRLAAIDRDRLSPVDRIAYDSFAWQRRLDARFHEPALVAASLPLALDHFNGVHLHFAELSSGDGAAPYASVADYDAGLARLDGFIAHLDLQSRRWREGVARGVVHPRVVIERLIEQFDGFARQRLADSPYGGPIRKLPPDWPAAERERLTRAYTAMIEERLAPACARLRDLLRVEVLPHARAGVGLGGMPGGAAYYRALVEQHTTTPLTPEAIHRLGLDEVARITAAMDAVRLRVGFGGTLPQFFEHIRTDPRLKPASAQALGDAYRAIGARVDEALPRLFSVRPKSPLEIRPMPAAQERSAAAASYIGGTPDGSRPGVFYYNTWDLPSRSLHTMETTYLHEAVPGHHFQDSVAKENAALPALLRFEGNAAYWEGWALYAESLGPELGLFGDPYQRFGHHDDEMLRAMRLVVDTGLHAMGWSRERAIDYLLAHSAMGRTEATAEVERYIVWAGQALSYKVGQLTIRRLREQAEARLGPRFELRAFHDQLLGTGALPLAVLEAKLHAWIAAEAAP